MTLYALVENGSLLRVMQRPKRFKGKAPVTDEELMQEGIYPILDVPPEYDEQTHHLLRNQTEEWRVTEYGVEVTYTIAPKAAADVKQRFSDAIQNMLDTAAQSRGYDSAISISTYFNSGHPRWSAEAQSFVRWRDEVLDYSYVELDKVMSGERDMPTIADFLAELPAITWPGG